MTPLNSTPFTEITMRSIEWLEKPLWQKSAFQLLSGPKGAGKGTYLAGLAARISQDAERAVRQLARTAPRSTPSRGSSPPARTSSAATSSPTRHVRLPDDVGDLRDLAAQPRRRRPARRRPGREPHRRQQLEQRSRSPQRDRTTQRIRRRPRVPPHRRPPPRQRPKPRRPRQHPRLDRLDRHTTRSRHGRSRRRRPSPPTHPGRRRQPIANGSAQAFRIEAVTVAGLTEPITLAVELGESTKSVDDLISRTNTELGSNASTPTRSSRPSSHAVATGEKSRNYLDEVCSDELGANTDTVYKRGLIPLKDAGRIKPAKTARPDAGTGGGSSMKLCSLQGCNFATFPRHTSWQVR